MKPIEPGCLVLILHGVAIGESGVVVSWVPTEYVLESNGDRAKYVGPDGWLVSFSDGAQGVFQPRYLLRIDGHEPMTSDEQEEACV